MDFKQLKYFLATADFGNMTRAAEAVHIAQSALSQQISSLEDELGVRLFDRGKQGMRLTSAGAILYSHAKSLLKQAGEARRAVSEEADKPHGRVCIGIPGSAGKMLAVPLLTRLARYPRIMPLLLERVSSDLVSLVASGHVDIAIAVDAQPCLGVKTIPFLLEELYVIARGDAPWRDRSALSMAELAEHPLILPNAPSTIRQRVDAAFLDAGLSYRLVSEISGTDMTLRLVEKGFGWSVLPWSGINEAVAQGRICALPMPENSSKRLLSFAVSDSVPLSLAAEKVLELLRQISDDLLDSGQWLGVERVSEESS